MLSPVEISVVGVALLLGYVGFCAVLHRCRPAEVWWCLPMALLLSATYAVNLHDFSGGTVYLGMGSDQVLNIAYVNTVIEGYYQLDFLDPEAPAHYSPLFFWIAGTVGRLLGQDGLTVWRHAPIAVLFGLPFLTLFVGSRLLGRRGGLFATYSLVALGSFHSSHFIGMLPYEYNPHHLVLYLLVKPHEVLGAILAVLWCLLFVRGPQPRASARWLWVQVAVSASTFLLYSPWFGVTGLVLGVQCLWGVTWTTRLRALGTLSLIAVASLLVTAVHWFPFVRAAIRSGTEWTGGTAHFLPFHLDPSALTVGMGHFGLLFFLGMSGCLQWRRNRTARVLLVGLAVTYSWFFSTFLTYPLLGFSFLPQRCELLVLVFLSFAAAIGLQRLRLVMRRLDLQRWLRPVALALIAALLLPSLLRWNALTDRGLLVARGPMPTNVTEIVRALDELGRPVLVGDSGQTTVCVAALSGARLYLAGNLTYANPLARYHSRALELDELATTVTSGHSLARALGKLGVDALLLRKDADGSYFVEYFTRRKRPIRAIHQSFLLQLILSLEVEKEDPEERVEVIRFSPALFEEGFRRVYEDDKSVLLARIP